MNQDIIKWWDDAWREGLWAASWSKSLEGLTGKQAAWKPSPDRHSIWQIAAHMIFWREYKLRRIAGAGQVSADELAKLNFPEPREITDAAWAAVVKRFGETQQEIRAVLAAGGEPAATVAYFVPHDSYHFGQINYLRAMLWLPPIE